MEIETLGGGSEYQGEAAFHFSTTNTGNASFRRPPAREERRTGQHRSYKPQTNSWQERSYQRRSHNLEERARYDEERYSRPPRAVSSRRAPTEQLSKSYYREVQKKTPEAKEAGSSASKSNQELRSKGNLRIPEHVMLSQDMLNVAREEVRDVMLQYTKCADPTEREARKERLRQAEERGQMEEAAVQLARASLAPESEIQNVASPLIHTERISVSNRLGTRENH